MGAKKSCPLYRTVPPVAGTSRSSVRPTVVFPHPLSPTNPSVRPAGTSKLTPSTAFTCPTVRDSRPRRIGK